MCKLLPSHNQNSYLMGAVRLILGDNQLYHYIDILVSLPILIALRRIIYSCKQIDEHFRTQVQSCESIQLFMRY